MKTLGQVAYEASRESMGLDKWWDKTPAAYREGFESAANAVLNDGRVKSLVEYASHASWRCGYSNKCVCGLDILTDQLGFERIPLPDRPEAGE
jgi:hypothetical protein